MGVDLYLRNKANRTILNFGRAHNYQINGEFPQSQGEIDMLYANTVDDFKEAVIKYAAYSPASLDELDTIKFDVESQFNDVLNILLRAGALQVIFNIVQDELPKGWKLVKE